MEIWKDIPGYEGYYQVSNRGRVRSLDRKIYRSDGKKHFRRGHLKSLSAKNNGYIQVGLRKDGHHKTGLVHQLVALAFLGPQPDGMEVNHKDGDKSNNVLDNLEYVSHKENVTHFIVVLKKGSRKLNSRKVYKIRELYWVDDVKVPDITYLFGVHSTTVRFAALGKTWKHVPFPPLCKMSAHTNANRKLTDTDIAEIKFQYKIGVFSMTQLSQQYNVSLSSISRIISGDRRADVQVKEKEWKQLEGVIV